MFCKGCGTELPTGASECPKCGKAVETIMLADEKKTESVAASDPKPTAGATTQTKKRAKSGKLILPVVLLVLSVGGLVYMYIGGTFSSIYSWFTSSAEEAKHLPSELNRGIQYDELIANYGMIVIAGGLVIIAVIGLIILFKRLGRKFTGKE